MINIAQGLTLCLCRSWLVQVTSDMLHSRPQGVALNCTREEVGRNDWADSRAQTFPTVSLPVTILILILSPWNPGKFSSCLIQFRLLYKNIIDWVIYKRQKFISHSSGIWKSETTVSEQMSSGEGSLLSWTANYWLLLVSSCDWEKREEVSSLVILTKALIAFTSAPPSWPHLNLITS